MTSKAPQSFSPYANASSPTALSQCWTSAALRAITHLCPSESLGPSVLMNKLMESATLSWLRCKKDLQLQHLTHTHTHTHTHWARAGGPKQDTLGGGMPQHSTAERSQLNTGFPITLRENAQARGTRSLKDKMQNLSTQTWEACQSLSRILAFHHLVAGLTGSGCREDTNTQIISGKVGYSHSTHQWF
jgi:hypothetical protein